MSKVFESFLDTLGTKSGYGYDFLVDRWNECSDECTEMDIDYFIGVTMERDW